MTRRAIGVSERPPLLQTIPLSFQHLFAMFGATDGWSCSGSISCCPNVWRG